VLGVSGLGVIVLVVGQGTQARGLGVFTIIEILDASSPASRDGPGRNARLKLDLNLSIGRGPFGLFDLLYPLVCLSRFDNGR
jgi:hypothetical protein